MTHTLSLRISPVIWRETQRYAELLEILRAAWPAISEVAFFTGFTHPPRPLAEIRDTARRLKDEIIPAFAYPIGNLGPWEALLLTHTDLSTHLL